MSEPAAEPAEVVVDPEFWRRQRELERSYYRCKHCGLFLGDHQEVCPNCHTAREDEVAPTTRR